MERISRLMEIKLILALIKHSSKEMIMRAIMKVKGKLAGKPGMN
jgi:hypothetical protein